MSSSEPKFCATCGCTLTTAGPGTTLVCVACHKVVYQGPSVVVMTLIFAEDRILLLKRGTAPYIGTWAPPGGFIEANESAEAAGVREIAEEVGLTLDSSQLVPHGIISIPTINQVCLSFLAVLNCMYTPKPTAPEALDARWFTLDEFPHQAMWSPAAAFDIADLFRQVRTRRFHFYQTTGKLVRLFGPDFAITS